MDWDGGCVWEGVSRGDGEVDGGHRGEDGTVCF